ncbi:MAG: SRPBCC family protein [Planctomycetota bacterium]
MTTTPSTTPPTPTVDVQGPLRVLEMTQRLPVRREALFPFFADAHNLERITPTFLKFRVITPKPIDMRVGALIDYRLKLHGIPIRWRTQITGWDPQTSFRDEQLRGPYKLWRHTHTFEEDGDATVCHDRVEYRVPGGPLAPLIEKWFVRKDVVSIFAYRAKALDELFPAPKHDPQPTPEPKA